jgi:hypothetical protein
MDESSLFDHATWHTSTLCSSGTCVAVAFRQDMIGMRDTKDPSGPVLVFSTGEWEAFISAVRGGEFDVPG